MTTRGKTEEERPLDPVAIGGAPAMRRSGFSDADIVAAIGAIPPINPSAGEFFAAMDAEDAGILAWNEEQSARDEAARSRDEEALPVATGLGNKRRDGATDNPAGDEHGWSRGRR